MSKKLTLVEAEALSRLAGKLVDEAKKDGKTMGPGNYTYDFTVKCDGSIGRGNTTKVTPQFKIESLLKAVILLYASELGEEDGLEWLEAVMDVNGVAGAVVQLGSSAALSKVDDKFTAVFERAAKALKEKHNKSATKVDRAGNTSVVGAVEKVPSYEGDLAGR